MTLVNSVKTMGRQMVEVVLITCWCALFVAAAGQAQAAVVSDLTISDAVEDELRRDQAVSTHWIDITTNEGIVTLSGGVDNLLAKVRAARIAETVKGVRAVVNTIKVVPPALRSDVEIKNDVEQALLEDPATESYQIEVSVEDNVVKLAGTVESWQERELCETVAMGVKGVKEIENSIVFKYQKDRPDYEIKQDIVQALRWDVLVDHALIEVSVKNGQVMLSGTVGSLAEKTRATADAYVANVKGVDAQNLEVRLWARDDNLKGDKYKRVSDSDIREAVKDALIYDPRVASMNITPEVTDGIVTLRGKVASLRAKRAAGQSARNTVGVIGVENRLKVRPIGTYSDEVLRDRIRAAFIRDPYLEKQEIIVTVQNGAVGLYGSVDSFFEKIRAANLASRVIGVVTVDNRLAVAEGVDPYPYYDPYLDDWYGSTPLYYHKPLLTFKADMQIKEDIEDELFWSPFVNSENVQVSVENGEATLTGTVGTWGEYNAASENAYEGGAVIVNNKLEVAPKG